MKKLFSMAAIFVMAFTLVGCTEVNDLEVRIEELNQDIFDINEELGTYVVANTELEEEITALEAEIALLQAQLFDNIITFTLTDEYGEFSSETVGYDDEFDGTLFDLLDDSLTVGYNDTDYGKYITSINNLNPKTGAYISFSKNGVSSIVGVELATFEDGDVFGFDVLWWDTLQQGVDDVIQLFLENHASDYVNSESVDYNVLLALNLLGITSEYVTVSEVETLVDDSTLVTTADYFKAIMKLNVVGVDSTELITELNAIVVPGGYGQTAYGLLAMDSITTSVDYSTFVTAALADFNTTTPFDLGLDAGGISIVALSDYSDIGTLITDYTSWISTSQLDSGGVVTRDMDWGGTTYPGTENASSMSQVILGLVANGIDPTGTDYTKGTNNLIFRLLEFGTDTGSFDYIKTDDLDEDLMFSTPQAFLALVSYQVYANTYSEVNPFDFN